MVNDCDQKAHRTTFFLPTLSKESFTSWWLWRVLITVLPVGLSSAVLGSGSAAQLTSPQGCNHLPHHLLITGACFDYHPTFNGKPPYDEYHCTQHKRRYKFSVPSRSAASPFLPSSPWTSRSHQTVQDTLGNKGNVKIKPYNRKGFCAFSSLHCAVSVQHDTRKCSIDLHNNCMLEALLNSNEVLPKTF